VRLKGVVKRASNEMGETYAMKIVSHETSGREEFDHVSNEVKMLYKLDHPNIIKMYQACSDKANTYIVLERCMVDLSEVMPENKVRCLAYRLLLALTYLHRRGICHLDLKPNNVMLKTPDPIDLKLIDFGYAHHIQSSLSFDPRGTKQYVAPEICCGFVSPVADMWSFGVLLYNWLSGEVPFQGKTLEEIFARAMYRSVQFDSPKYAHR
jgi:calcium-dependent protein kinase